jgi:hypothetical protein
MERHLRRIDARMYRTKQSGNKYGSTSHEFNGRIYHSKAEAHYAQDLDLMLKAGELKEVIPQFKISLDVFGKHICNYIIDFRVIHKDDSIEYIECKGFATDTWRLKWKLTEAILNETEPGSVLTVVMV